VGGVKVLLETTDVEFFKDWNGGIDRCLLVYVECGYSTLTVPGACSKTQTEMKVTALPAGAVRAARSRKLLVIVL